MRKFLLPILLLILFIVGCSKPFNDQMLEEKNGIKYHPDNKQYSGKIYKNYSDGSLEHKGSYKHGNKNGVWAFYDREGKVIDINLRYVTIESENQNILAPNSISVSKVIIIDK